GPDLRQDRVHTATLVQAAHPVGGSEPRAAENRRQGAREPGARLLGALRLPIDGEGALEHRRATWAAYRKEGHVAVAGLLDLQAPVRSDRLDVRVVSGEAHVPL